MGEAHDLACIGNLLLKQGDGSSMPRSRKKDSIGRFFAQEQALLLVMRANRWFSRISEDADEPASGVFRRLADPETHEPPSWSPSSSANGPIRCVGDRNPQAMRRARSSL